VLAWRTVDTLGVDPRIVCHKLSVHKNARPDAQKKRKMGEEKNNSRGRNRQVTQS